MKRLLSLTLATAFIVASATAMAGAPTVHEGYPYGGKSTDFFGKVAETKAIKANETILLGSLPDQLKAAEDNDRMGIRRTGDSRLPAHPGYPYRDQTADMVR